MIHPTGVAALRRSGLLDRISATGCPPVDTYSFDFGPFTISGNPRPYDGGSTAYAPRRTVLDKILVDAAADSGAEMRERFSVDEVIVEDGAVVGIRGDADGSSPVEARARVVVGADGRNSRVADAVQPKECHQKPALQWASYTYWSGLPLTTFETFIRPHRGLAAIPTNDELTLVIVGWPIDEADVEANYLRPIDMGPRLRRPCPGRHTRERFHGGAVRNFFRQPFGPGWVLVGNAGYYKDRINAHGISDAFRDAQACADALGEVFAGRETLEAAMVAVQQRRDAQVTSIYDAHHRDGHPGSPAARHAATARLAARQPAGDGRLHQRHRRNPLAARLLQRRRRVTRHGRRHVGETAPQPGVAVHRTTPWTAPTPPTSVTPQT